MASVLLSDELVELEVEAAEIGETEQFQGGATLGVGVARQLQAFDAPADLIRAAAVCEAGVNDAGVDEEAIASRIRDFFGSGDDDGELVSSEIVYLPMRVLGAASPPTADSEITATLALEKTREAGIEIKVVPIGFKGAVKFTVKREISLECKAGEAKFGWILIPADLEVRMWTPRGAGEAFAFTRLIPRRSNTLGSRSSGADVREVMAGSGIERAPIGGDVTDAGSQQQKREVSWELSLGLEFGKKASLGLSAGVNGSVEVQAEYKVPPGSYWLNWLSSPAGASITTREP